MPHATRHMPKAGRWLSPMIESDGSSKGATATVFDAAATRDAATRDDADAADDEDDDSRFRSTGGAAEWSAAGWSAAKSRDDRTSSLANTR